MYTVTYERIHTVNAQITRNQPVLIHTRYGYIGSQCIHTRDVLANKRDTRTYDFELYEDIPTSIVVKGSIYHITMDDKIKYRYNKLVNRTDVYPN